MDPQRKEERKASAGSATPRPESHFLRELWVIPEKRLQMSAGNPHAPGNDQLLYYNHGLIPWALQQLQASRVQCLLPVQLI